METEAEKIPQVLKLLKENVVIVTVGGLGLLFLFVGGLAMLGKKKTEVQFEKAEVMGKEDKGEDKEDDHTLFVDVSGEVKKPGVYELSQNARVRDALLAAGGVRDSADQEYVSRYINLSQILSDGLKIYIPKKQEALPGGSIPSTPLRASLINLNTASQEELESLPGVGKVTAEQIIQLRPYGSIDELLKKKAVTQKMFNKIKDRISVY